MSAAKRLVVAMEADQATLDPAFVERLRPTPIFEHINVYGRRLVVSIVTEDDF